MLDGDVGFRVVLSGRDGDSEGLVMSGNGGSSGGVKWWWEC